MKKTDRKNLVRVTRYQRMIEIQNFTYKRESVKMSISPSEITYVHFWYQKWILHQFLPVGQ